ncbi:thioredoxin domain-containing protein [Thiomonas sp.]
MNGWRSKTLLGAGLLLASWMTHADPVYLVELANFACPHCDHMHAYEPGIAQAVKATGGEFDFAPAPAEKQSDSAAKIYYAARQQGPVIAAETESLLFEAMAVDGLPVQNATQGIVFLQQDWPKTIPAPDYDKLARDTADAAVEAAANKAITLGADMGASRLPAFIFIQNGAPVGMLARGARYPTMPRLRQAVLQAIGLYATGARLPASTPPAAKDLS